MTKLIKLQLEGFGKFSKETTIEFSDGINFINGPNEVGKSTILEAITASIFKYTLGQIEPFFCWMNKEICRTALTYKTDNNEIFKITSDYKSNKRKIEKEGENKTIEISTVEKNIKPLLKKHFGFEDKNVFENTVFIRQSQMAILADNAIRNKIKDMIEEIFVGRSKASATKALKKIEKTEKDNISELDVLKSEKYELKDKLQKAKEDNEKVSKDSNEAKDVSKNLSNKSGKLSKLKKDYEMFQEKERNLKENKNFKDKIDKINKVLLEIEEKIKERNQKLEQKNEYIGYDSISDSDFASLKELIDKIGELEISRKTIKESGFSRKITKRKINPKYLTIFIFGILMMIFSFISIFVNIIGFFIFLILGVFLIIYTRKKIKFTEEQEVPDKERGENLKKLYDKIKSSELDLKNKTKDIKNFDKKTFPDKFNKYSKLVNEIDSMSSSVSSIIKTELEENEISNNEKANIKKIELKKIELLDELSVIQNNLKKYKLVDFKQNDFDDLEALEDEVNNLKNREVELKTSINTTHSFIESPEEIEEKINSKKNDEENLQNKIEEYKLAAQFLKLAESNVRHKFTPAIEKNIKPILEEITNRRYSEMRIEEENLDIKIKAPEIKEYVDVFFLSQGTRDQLYFALRIIISSLLSGNKNIPIILDDPFHNFDDTRLSKAINAIKKISKERQIILISHREYHKKFKNFADNIITLNS